ncbi:short chain dehydrogenase [Chitinimonas lacunae]|uniref:Short chain dehydrogenase n=1 Tax=Chitinimonas lacunae TaxID=1963018 RepID=A0ABV8MQY6_9NEIS
MKIVLIGAHGAIGSAVAAELGQRHQIIPVSRSRGDYQADMADLDSVRALLHSIDDIDAVVATAGAVHFGPLTEMTPEQIGVGLREKLMGQVNLVLTAQQVLKDGGSITLTSGILSSDPIRYGSAASLVNGGLDSFVRAAAIELPRGLRINIVSPNLLQESVPDYGDYFPGFDPVPAARVAKAYAKSVEGAQTGQIYTVW